MNPMVGVVMGSTSDLSVMQEAGAVLEEFAVPYEIRVLSAHRTPEDSLRYAREARSRGIRVIIAGAGGAAHLPGVLAAATPIPIIGVPVSIPHLDGFDSLLSIVQMPAGVPVATVGIGAARNAGLLAVRILGLMDGAYLDAMEQAQEEMAERVRASDEKVRTGGTSATSSSKGASKGAKSSPGARVGAKKKK